MSAESKAVFLSYASQDAGAAKRIADALRGFGVEVWFDQSDLRGGDQWDAKIRGQIKSCGIFIAVISKSTETRDEAYFRLEWKLGEDRSQLMAPGKVFIVPVVIDDTPEYGATVPESFNKAQWTRLPGGEPTTAFIDQIKRLTQPKAPVSAQAPSAPQVAVATSNKRGPVFALILIAAAVVTVLGFFFLPRNAREAAPAQSVAKSPPAPHEKSIPAKSIAVLPFENRSDTKEDLYFTDGFHDDLLTQISRIKDIKTISRTSVMTYRDTTKNMRQIGEELGVAKILEGGVQRAGNQIRINVQLIDAATDTHLWAETYTRQLTAENVFAIQSEIAAAITNALKAVLSPAEQRQFERLPTQNLEALEAYFRAVTRDGTAEGTREAIEHLKHAIELDPEFADAYALLGGLQLLRIWTEGLPDDEQVAVAEPSIRRALELDGNSSNARIVLGALNYRKGELTAAEKAFRRAIELNPNNAAAYTNYGLLQLWGLRDVHASIVSFQKAFELDPVNPEPQQHLAEALLAAGRFEESGKLLKKLFESKPDFVEGLRAYADLQATGYGRFDEAVRGYRRVVELDPRNPNFVARLALYHFSMGDNVGAEFWLKRALVLAPQSQDADFFSGMLHLVRGEQDEALAAFRNVPGDANFHGNAVFYMSEAELESGHFEGAIARDEELVGPIGEIDQSNIRAACNLAYLLSVAGRREEADQWIARILTALPSLARMGTWGYRDGDALVYLAQGNHERAVAALRELLDAGGSDVYFGTGSFFEKLSDDPGFQALLENNEKRLTEQRANLARMEAAGELAPIPPLPEAAH